MYTYLEWHQNQFFCMPFQVRQPPRISRYAFSLTLSLVLGLAGATRASCLTNLVNNNEISDG